MRMRSLRCGFFISALALAFIHSAAFAEDLTIPGSGNPEYTLRKLAEAFNSQQTRHRVIVPTSIGTAGALREAEEGAASLVRVGRPLTAGELGRGLTYVPLGRDPVVFAAGAAVTVRAITGPHVLAVYRGEITDWKELGGEPGPIRAIGREVTDASRRAISLHLKEFGELEFAAGVKVVHLDPEKVELLDRYPTSLGFLNASALRACKTKINVLALDAVEPTMENLGSGRYPLWLEFGLAYKRGALTPAGEAFLDFVKSPGGVRVLRELGVLPVDPKP